MCLLIFKPADVEIPFSHLENGAFQNSHGSGICIADGSDIIIRKAHNYKARDIQKVLDDFPKHPAIIHFRFATHGSKNFMNTHPFWLNDKWAAAHNGVINKVECEDDESDTRAFLRIHVKPLLAMNCRLDDSDILHLLSEEMGSYNKMVYLSADGKVGIANEGSGHWSNGIWYSNHDYTGWQTEWESYHHHPRFYHRGGSCQLPSTGTKYFPKKPEPVENDEEKEQWHQFDAARLLCSVCDKRIEGEFKVGGTTGLTVCELCEFFGEGDDPPHNPHMRSSYL